MQIRSALKSFVPYLLSRSDGLISTPFFSLGSTIFTDAGEILCLSNSFFLAEALVSRLMRDWALVANVATQR